LIPTLGKDRLLKTGEAVRVMKERGEDIGEVGRALFELVKEGKVRVWLCSDGRLRYRARATLHVAVGILRWIQHSMGHPYYIRRLLKDE